MEIAIIDLSAGNIKSIENFFKRNFDCKVHIYNSPSNELDNSDILIIPGVGNFGHIECLKFKVGIIYKVCKRKNAFNWAMPWCSNINLFL